MLFAPDIFSTRQPTFSELSGNQRSILIDIFLEHFGESGIKVNSVQQAGGLEINSQNFAIHTSQGSYLLKVHANTEAQDRRTVERQYCLMSWLQEKSQPVPRPVRGHTGQYLCQIDDARWASAMSFVDGEFFAGAPSSLEAVGKAVGDFHCTLQGTPSELVVQKNYQALGDVDREMLQLFLTDNRERRARVDLSCQFLLRQHRAIIDQAWGLVLDHEVELASAETGVVHIDLHPHNLLLRGDKPVCILDFDSLMIGPVKIMLGFSGYKLLRQVVCFTRELKDGSSPRSHLDRYFEAIFSAYGSIFTDPSDLALYAYAEVCRRITLILRLNLQEDNKDWNHVLPMHIAGLYEIGQLFRESRAPRSA